jgi:ppGpp synthetase/RelA/SpoT-type nucleotidyltranferase
MYKHEDEIPDVLKREIHALAGAMATADTAFQAIRDKRDAYIKSVKAYASKMDLEEVETNLDSVREYLSQKFPQRK